jgi:hypothetical protein
MALSSILSTYRTFGVALLEAKDKNPKLDLDEFMKSFFGGEVTIRLEDVKVTQTKKPPPVKKAEPKASDKPMCTAMTAKGTQCTKCAVGGGPLCSIHLKKTNGETKKKDKPSSSKKVTKELPKHNHPPGDKRKGKDCELCNTFGDVLDPSKVVDFEEVQEEEVDSKIGDPDFLLEEEAFED